MAEAFEQGVWDVNQQFQIFCFGWMTISINYGSSRNIFFVNFKQKVNATIFWILLFYNWCSIMLPSLHNLFNSEVILLLKDLWGSLGCFLWNFSFESWHCFWDVVCFINDYHDIYLVAGFFTIKKRFFYYDNM